jgi:transcription initiation factor TFIIB
MGLYTIIGKEDRDARGNKIDVMMRSTINRLRIWDFRTQACTPTDRNLMHAFNELDILKDKLGLPYVVVEKTAYIYRKAQERGFVRGRSISAVLAAAIYIACREMTIPRTIKDIAKISNIKHKVISKTFRQLLLELDIKVPIADPMKCIVKVANNANLNEKTTRHAINMMNDITKSRISVGKNPMSIAATVLYISCIKIGEKNITQDSISQAAGITGVTLRNRLNDVKKTI